MLAAFIAAQSKSIARIQTKPRWSRPGMLVLKAKASPENPRKNEIPALARNR